MDYKAMRDSLVQELQTLDAGRTQFRDMANDMDNRALIIRGKIDLLNQIINEEAGSPRPVVVDPKSKPGGK